MTTRELIHEKRDEILALTAKHKAKHVRLFGSVVRGDDTPESDVDFLVEFEPQTRLMEKLRFMVELEDLLGRRADVVEEKAVEGLFSRRVLHEAQAV